MSRLRRWWRLRHTETWRQLKPVRTRGWTAEDFDMGLYGWMEWRRPYGRNWRRPWIPVRHYRRSRWGRLWVRVR